MNDNMQMIPYYVHEGEMARLERHTKKLWILCIIIFVALIGTNAGWLWYESQFEDEVITQEVEQDVDTGNGSAYVAGIGDVYGEGETAG